MDRVRYATASNCERGGATLLPTTEFTACPGGSGLLHRSATVKHRINAQTPLGVLVATPWVPPPPKATGHKPIAERNPRDGGTDEDSPRSTTR